MIAAPSTERADVDLQPGSLEEYAFQYGRSYDSYLVTEPGWEGFWSEDAQGVAAVTRHGRHAFVSGGLLAPPEQQEELLTQLVEHATMLGHVLTFFNITEEQLPLFRRCGFQATKWGEEALIDLPGCTWSGKPYEWVRRQSNFCRRHGLAVSECGPAVENPAQWRAVAAELAEVSSQFLADKPQAEEIRFLQSRFDPRRLGRKRVFLARADGGHGRIEGFVACNPCAGGAIWSIETYRHRPDAVRGTVPFLIHQVVEQFKAEGVQRVSLCLIPGLRCREPQPGDSALARWGLTVGTHYCNLLFDTVGTYHFKTRFRPRFENRYLCVRPRMTPAVAWAFIRLLGVLRLDLPKLCRLTVQRWRKRSARATLWTPDAEASETTVRRAA